MLCNSASLFGGPNGVRTRVSALRGPCPRPLDDGAGRASTARVYSLCSRRTSVAAETKMAGGGGLEPPLPGPEPGVLPLDDPPAAVAIVRGRRPECQGTERTERRYCSESLSERLGLKRGTRQAGIRMAFPVR